MSAHSRPLMTKCAEVECSSRATEEVFNTYNASMGKFCKKHAAQRVKKLQEREKPRPLMRWGQPRR